MTKMNTSLITDNVTNTNNSSNSSYIFLEWIPLTSTVLQCLDFDCVYAERYREEFHDGLVTLTIVLSLIAAVGGVGNTTVIVVFSRTKIKNTSIYFMLLLAITDLFVCIFVIPGFIVRQWRYKFYFDAFCKIWELLRSASVPTSSMIMVAIASDRFLIVYMNGKIKITKLVSRIVILLIMISGLCLGIPQSLAMGVYYHKGQGHLVNGGYCMTNLISISIPVLLNFWYFVTAIFCGMIIVTFIMYTLIFITAYKQDRKWNKFRSSKVKPLSFLSHSKSDVTNEGDTSTSKVSTAKPTASDNCNVDKNPKTDMQVTDVAKGAVTRFLQFNTVKQVSILDLYLDSDKKNNPSNPEKNQPRPMTDKNLDSFSVKETIKIRNQNFGKVGTAKQPFQISSLTFGNIDDQRYHGNIPGPSNINRTQMPKVHLSQENIDKIDTVSQENIDEIESGNQPKDQTLAKSRIKIKSNENTFNSTKRKKIHWKTTQILFTVTIVYIASFLPIFLMSYDLIPQNKIIYYMYFLNNVANPIIYSFMNQKFRADVKKVFCKCQKP